MSLFRNIGHRFRRGDGLDSATPFDVPLSGGTGVGAIGGGGGLSDTHGHGGHTLLGKLHPQNQANTLQPLHDDAELPDLYYEDRSLGVSIHALEQVRAALRHLTICADEHARQLQASAHAQRALGDALTTVLSSSDSVEGDQNVDIRQSENIFREGQHPGEDTKGSGKGGHGNGGNDKDEQRVHLGAVMPKGAAEAQESLGEGMTHLAEVSGKLSVAIAKPINELTTAFEARYARKIVPLRKRYADQKGQYLKYMRSADMAESDEKRSYYEALADAAKPVWARTSTELRTEADVMTELTAKNIAQWSRTIALQHERAFAISNANMADAFSRAKHLGSANARG